MLFRKRFRQNKIKEPGINGTAPRHNKKNPDEQALKRVIKSQMAFFRLTGFPYAGQALLPREIKNYPWLP